MTDALAGYISTAQTRTLAPEVLHKAAEHLLDTVAAMVSGADLAAGRMAIAAAHQNPGLPQSIVIMAGLKTGMVEAALANGMLAHADETDDSHAPSLTHPGCAVVPAALAVAQARGVSGLALLKAVVAGYDVGPRVSLALGGEDFFRRHHSSHAVGGLFGALAAASTLQGLDRRQCRHALSYAAQMASGLASWRRDPDHIEKAFDFGGMPAMNGTLAARMVAAGFTGVEDALEGVPGLLSAHPAHADAVLATEGLGTRFEILRTAVKKWCVGSPIQAALDALEQIMADEGLRAERVAQIVVAMPPTSAKVVDNRDMPDVNLQHQLALMLADGTVTFESGHDHGRMHDPALRALRARILIDPSDEAEFVEFPRAARVSVTCDDGRRMVRMVRHVRGTPGNPMTTGEIVDKAVGLMTPALGRARAEEVSARILALEGAESLDPVLTLIAGERR